LKILLLNIFLLLVLQQQDSTVTPVSASSVSRYSDRTVIANSSFETKKTEPEIWKLKSPELIVNQNTNTSLLTDFEPFQKKSQQSWLFYLFLSLLFFIAFIRVVYTREFIELFYIFKPISINQQLYRDSATGVRIASIWLNINFVLIISVYIYLLNSYFQLYTGNERFLLLLIGGVSILLIARYSLLKIIASLFPFKKEINFYHFNELQINRVTGILILPFAIVIAFSPSVISYYAVLLSIGILAAMLLFRYLRGFIIGGEYFARNKFHFLIYICTLEIAPIVILVKLLKEWVSNL